MPDATLVILETIVAVPRCSRQREATSINTAETHQR